MIDAAIRWLAMPVPSWESELVNAMTALENLLDVELSTASRLFQNTSRFRQTASKLRERMLELGSERMPRAPLMVRDRATGLIVDIDWLLRSRMDAAAVSLLVRRPVDRQAASRFAPL